MLGFDYHKTARHTSSVCLSGEWTALQVIILAGRSVYRAVTSAKCKRCRKILRRPSAIVACAPAHGPSCPICGNPYFHVERHRRIHTPDGWKPAPAYGGGGTTHWQTIQGH